MKLAEWIRHRWKAVITGRDGSPMLIRYRLLDTRWGGFYVHHFLRSDQDRDLHDHPWSFTSLIVWGGYFEELPRAQAPWPYNDQHYRYDFNHRTTTRWCGPFSIVRHRATDEHRVDLERDRTAWTLIWVSPKVREWGFHTKDGWVPWREYVA